MDRTRIHAGLRHGRHGRDGKAPDERWLYVLGEQRNPSVACVKGRQICIDAALGFRPEPAATNSKIPVLEETGTSCVLNTEFEFYNNLESAPDLNKKQLYLYANTRGLLYIGPDKCVEIILLQRGQENHGRHAKPT